MDQHNPLLRKAFACFVVGFGLCFLYVFVPHTFIIVFGCLITGIGIAETIFVYIHSMVEARERNYQAQVEVIKALSAADPEVRSSFGSWFPEYDLVFTDEAKWYWQGVVPVEIFVQFMRESGEQYTVAQRVWKEKGNAYWRYWELIHKELLKCGLVIEASSKGSHSEMWRGNGYKRAWEMWMYNIPRVNQLQEME